MKRFFLVVLMVVLLLSPAFAFKKGSKGIGGTFSLSMTPFESKSWFNLTIVPDLSFFVADNFSLDIRPGFSWTWGTNFKSRSGFWLGIGARYFYKKFYSGFSYWIESGEGCAYNNCPVNPFQLRFGRLFSIAKNVYLNAELNYDFESIISAKAGFSIILK